jgi:hypothetical protein
VINIVVRVGGKSDDEMGFLVVVDAMLLKLWRDACIVVVV